MFPAVYLTIQLRLPIRWVQKSKLFSNKFIWFMIVKFFTLLSTQSFSFKFFMFQAGCLPFFRKCCLAIRWPDIWFHTLLFHHYHKRTESTLFHNPPLPPESVQV
jgi:hypothetical protein